MSLNTPVVRPPASSSNTDASGSLLSRFASTQPAEPAPTITKSWMDDFIDLDHGHDLGEQRHLGDELAGARRDGFLIRGPVRDPDADDAGVGGRAGAVLAACTLAHFDAMQALAEDV